MGDHLAGSGPRIMERVAGERNWALSAGREKEEKLRYRRSRVKGSSPETLLCGEGTAALPGQKQDQYDTVHRKRHYKAALVVTCWTVLLGKSRRFLQKPLSRGSEPLLSVQRKLKYIALTGVSRAVKEGEKVSGDQYATMESVVF